MAVSLHAVAQDLPEKKVLGEMPANSVKSPIKCD
jgi:hypothetical protein